MKRESAVVRQRPRSRGPDHRAYITANFRYAALAATDEAKLHPDGGARVIFIFDFRLSQRSAVIDAPIDRLAAAIDVTLLHEIEKRACDGGLIVRAHGQIGIVPPPENPEPLEISLVLLNVARGELPAELSKLRGRHLPFSTQLFFHLRFNREPMAIPPRNVRSVMPRHAHERLEIPILCPHAVL